MDLNSTIDIIIKDLNEAREIIDDLKNYPGVPEFQIELAKSKCKSASDVIALIKRISLTAPPPAETHEPHAEHVTEKAEPYVEPVIEKSEPRVEPVIEKSEPRVEPVIEKAEPQAVKEVPRPSDKKPSGFSIIADQFAGMPESFNENLGTRKHGDDVLEILRSKPLSSLDEAIGINDKFLFIREIFNGNTDSYNEAIQKLEKVGNISDAMAVIMGYAGDNSGSEAVTQLVDLIKRKFIAHE
jgi:copper chaperone CopZ